MNKKALIGIIVGGVLLAGACFAGGYLLRERSAGGGSRGALAELSRAERAQLREMSSEERQAFLEQRGITPANGAGGPGGGQANNRGAAGRREQVLEGTVASVDSEELSLTLSTGGSAKVYLDDATIVATAAGANGKLAEGSEVLIVASQAAEGVTDARAVIVK
jgi:hypothetical protein